MAFTSITPSCKVYFTDLSPPSEIQGFLITSVIFISPLKLFEIGRRGCYFQALWRHTLPVLHRTLVWKLAKILGDEIANINLVSSNH